MSLQKQIDLIMTTILKNTDKIYEENPGDNYRVDGANRLSYIRVVRMFTTTVDFKDMMKKHKKGGIEGGHGLYLFVVIKSVSDCCLTLSEKFVSYIMVRTVHIEDMDLKLWVHA